MVNARTKRISLQNPVTDLATEKKMQMVTIYFIKMLHGTRESSAIEDGIFLLLGILSNCPCYSFVKGCRFLVPIDVSANSLSCSLFWW